MPANNILTTVYSFTAAELQNRVNTMGARFDGWFHEAEVATQREAVQQVFRGAVGSNARDQEVWQVMQAHYYAIPQATRPAEPEILNRVVGYMGLAGQEDPCRAILALARADWSSGRALSQNAAATRNFGTSAFESVRRLIDFTGLTPREAVSALVGTNWDYRRASENFTEEQEESETSEDDSGSESSAMAPDAVRLHTWRGPQDPTLTLPDTEPTSQGQACPSQVESWS